MTYDGFFKYHNYGLAAMVFAFLLKILINIVKQKKLFSIDLLKSIWVLFFIGGCSLLYMHAKPQMTKGLFDHMFGLIYWGIAVLLIYQYYCQFCEIDSNPAVYVRLMLFPVLIGLYCLIWPWIQSDTNHVHDNQLQIFFQTLHYAWRTFTLENSFEEIWGAVNSVKALTVWDKTYISGLAVFAPLLTLSVALSFFKVPMLMVKLLLLRRTDVYIFSELNDRSIRYAEAMQYTVENSRVNLRGKPIIVFCTNKEKEKQDDFSLNALNAVPLRRSIDHLHFIWLARNSRIHFYLISDDENLKTQQAQNLCKKYRNCNIRFVTPEKINEAKIDEINKAVKDRWEGDWRYRMYEHLKNENQTKCRKMAWKWIEKHFQYISFTVNNGAIRLCNRGRNIRSHGVEPIEEAQMALYTELFDRPILGKELLDKLYETDNPQANILILGGGRIGAELARICLWYCQLPNLKVEVTVADKLSDIELKSRILDQYQNFELYQKTIFENSIPAQLSTWGNMNLMTDQLYCKLDQDDQRQKNYHLIFICTGIDDQNYQLSIRLRRYYLRKELAWGCPDIHTVIWNDIMADLINPEKHKALGGIQNGNMDYNIQYGRTSNQRHNEQCKVTIFGNMSDSIWKSQRVWYEALRYHALYSGEAPNNLLPLDTNTIRIRYDTLRDFCLGADRNRRSSMALAVHGKCKEQWRTYKNESDKIETIEKALAEAEHRRWCIYELIEGHCPVPDGKDEKYFSTRKDKLFLSKNRDTDEVRGYHVVMRNWKSLQELGQDEASQDGEHVDWNAWKDAFNNNTNIIRFSHSLSVWERKE